MKRTWTAVLLALPAFAACSENDVTAPQPAASGSSPALALDGGRPRPFEGRCETSIAIVPPRPEDTPNILRLREGYVCRLSHLGRVTAVAEQIVIFTGPTTAISSNRTTWTAANGDQLFGAWSGTAVTAGPDVTFSGLERFVGSTGRFKNARGDAWITGTATFITNKGVFTMRGKLRY